MDERICLDSAEMSSSELRKKLLDMGGCTNEISVITDIDFRGFKIVDFNFRFTLFIDCTFFFIDFDKCGFFNTAFVGCKFRNSKFNKCTTMGMQFIKNIARNTEINGGIISSLAFTQNEMHYCKITKFTMENGTIFGSEISNTDIKCGSVYTTSISNFISSFDTFTKVRFHNVSFTKARFNSDNFTDNYLDYKYVHFIDPKFYSCEGHDKFVPMACPSEGSFIGYKVCQDSIAVLNIPEDARRSSAYGIKCRCDRAIPIMFLSFSGETLDRVDDVSMHDINFKYQIGKMAASNFDENRWEDCSEGIHFFMSLTECKEYINALQNSGVWYTKRYINEVALDILKKAKEKYEKSV